MNSAKQRRKINKLEPIDWHEYANDAVLNGNMSTLFHRPLSEDSQDYASPEALVEIEKRLGRPVESAVVLHWGEPGNGVEPTVGPGTTVGASAAVDLISDESVDRGMSTGDNAREIRSWAPGQEPTVGRPPTVNTGPRVGWSPTVSDEPTPGAVPTVRKGPTVGAMAESNKRPQESPPVENMGQGNHTVGSIPTVGTVPTVGGSPTAGTGPTVGRLPTIRDTANVTGVVSHYDDDNNLDSSSLHEGEQTADIGGRKGATLGSQPTVGDRPTVADRRGGGLQPAPQERRSRVEPTVGTVPTVGLRPTVGGLNSRLSSAVLEQRKAELSSDFPRPTVSPEPRTHGAKAKVRSIYEVQDALTLAGQVLYKSMYGAPDGARSKTCTKGYRQLASETRLDKDTVRDLICEFKEKGMVREIGTYNPDTRASKTYDVLSYKTILQLWRDAGIHFVTSGRKRPIFCTAMGVPIAQSPLEIATGGTVQNVSPTVGVIPTVGPSPSDQPKPTVGMASISMPDTSNSDSRTNASPDASVVSGMDVSNVKELLVAMREIAGKPVDQDAAERLIKACRAGASDCTIDEILEFTWSKAYLCRSRKIDNPIGFLITQVPKHFLPDALRSHREHKRLEFEAASGLAARAETEIRQNQQEYEEAEGRHRLREEISERHRTEKGIDLKELLQDPSADEVLIGWVKRQMKNGYRYKPSYE